MALDVTASPHPNFKRNATAGTTATEIRAQPHSQVQIFASGAIYVFNDVADGGSAPGTDRLAVTATQAAAGYVIAVGGKIPGQSYGTVCVAAQASTVDLTVVSVPAIREAP